MNKNLKLAIAWSILLTIFGVLCWLDPVFMILALLLGIIAALVIWAIGTVLDIF